DRKREVEPQGPRGAGGIACRKAGPVLCSSLHGAVPAGLLPPARLIRCPQPVTPLQRQVAHRQRRISLTFAYRRMTSAAARRLSNIALDVFDEPVDPARLSAYLAAPGHLMVLAFDGDLVVGQCTGVVHHHPDKATELYVDEVGTDTAYLRRG